MFLPHGGNITMAYPHAFVTNCLATIRDGHGNTSVNVELMLFRPLLGCQFNGPQVLIAGHTLPEMAGEVMRGLLRVPFGSPLNITPGPGVWATNVVPSIQLNDDPNAERWYIMDALPWSYGMADRLWSFYAAKDYVSPPPPPPPPPPPSPTPLIMGASSASATLATFGVNYLSVLAPGGVGFAYAPRPGGVGYSIVADAGTSSFVGTSALGGNHSGFTFPEGTPTLGGPGTVTVTGGGHTGPDQIVQASNVDLINPHVFYWHMPP